MPSNNNKMHIYLLIAMSLLTAISIDLYLPSLPFIAEYFHATPSQVKLTLSVFLSAFAISQLFLGPLSDRFGRKPVFLFGMGIYLISCLMCSLSLSIQMLVFSRFIQAIGACSSSITAFAAARDLFEKEHRAKILALMSTLMCVSPVLAPILGGYLQHFFGWRSNFIFLFILGVFLFFCVFKKFPETNKSINNFSFSSQMLVKNYKVILSNMKFIINTFCLSCAFSGVFLFIVNSPFILINQSKISVVNFGYFYGINSLALIIGGFMTTRLVMRVSLEKIIFIGAIFSLLGSLMMLSLPAISVWTFIGPMILCSLGFAMIIPMAITGALEPFPEMSGAATAMLNCMRYLAAAIIPAIVSFFSRASQHSLAVVLIFISALVLLGMRRQIIGYDETI